MWWSVRAVDLAATLAMVAVVGGGGLIAVTGPSGPSSPSWSGYAAPTTVETVPRTQQPSSTASPEQTDRSPADKDNGPTDRPRRPDTGTGTSTGTGRQPESEPSPSPTPPAPPAEPPASPAPVPTVPAPITGVEKAPAEPAAPSTHAASAELVVSSFNVLGTSHTRRGERGFAPGPVRAQWAAQLIRAHQVDIVGLQELQPDQRRVITSTLSEYDIWPGDAVKEGRAWVNSIMWRADTWQAVESSTTPIPYFKGRTYQMPYLRLRNLQTGAEVWVANFHNPASTKRSGNNARWRVEARRRQIVLANRLYETGVPVIFTGDMNEREEYFCPVVGATALEASNGGSVVGTRCDVPDNPRIDWIFGTPEIEWLSSSANRSDLVRRTTDHPMIVARGRLTTG